MKCSNPNCNFDVDGSCIDGLSLDDCPSLSKELNLELISPEQLDLGDNVDLVDEDVSLEDAKQLLIGQNPLSESEVSYLLKERLGKVISFVGPVGVGKTTLISSMYDIFNRPHKLNISFGRSLSIYALEKLCHHARVTSKSTSISTPRTSSSSGVGFYHISIQDSKKKRQEIFLADRSGENYTEMVDDISLGQNFCELKRSDLICILVGSNELGNCETRHLARRKTINLIKSVLRAVGDKDLTTIALLLTKFDLIDGSKEEKLCNSEVERIRQSLFKDCSLSLEVIPLAARPCLEEQEKPDTISKLWAMIEDSKKPQIKIMTNRIKSKRSFHNLELLYD